MCILRRVPAFYQILSSPQDDARYEHFVSLNRCGGARSFARQLSSTTTSTAASPHSAAFGEAVLPGASSPFAGAYSAAMAEHGAAIFSDYVCGTPRAAVVDFLARTSATQPTRTAVLSLLEGAPATGSEASDIASHATLPRKTDNPQNPQRPSPRRASPPTSPGRAGPRKGFTEPQSASEIRRYTERVMGRVLSKSVQVRIADSGLQPAHAYKRICP